MRPSLFPSDDALPTWLHTALCIGICLPFTLTLWWAAFDALASGQLEPLGGPSFGQYFFGPQTLYGRAATRGAVALLLLGTAFLTLGLSFSRHAAEHPILKKLPWLFLLLGLGTTVSVIRSL